MRTDVPHDLRRSLSREIGYREFPRHAAQGSGIGNCTELWAIYARSGGDCQSRNADECTSGRLGVTAPDASMASAVGFAARGCSNDQFWLQYHRFRGWWHLGAENPEGNARGRFTDASAVLIDAGKTDSQRIVIVQVAAANDRHIFRNPHSVFDGIVHRTGRQRIVVAKNAVRFWLEVQELSHRLRTSQFGIYVDLSHRRDVTVLDRDSQTHQRSFVSLQTGDSRTGLRPADVRDPFASDRDQVFGGEPADGNIVDSDIVRGGAGDRAINQNIRCLVPLNPDD